MASPPRPSSRPCSVLQRIDAPKHLPVMHNYDLVADIVTKRVGQVLPPAYRPSVCSPRPGLPATEAQPAISAVWSLKPSMTWRSEHHRGRRPGVWAPGEVLVIDWGVEGRPPYLLCHDGLFSLAVRAFCPRRKGAYDL